MSSIPIVPPKIRVLVVDDSAVMRKIIATALQRSSQIEVAGFAVNGLDAIIKVSELKPDVITLDIEMPEMDGLTALKELRKVHTRLPIIMFSTLTMKGAQATVMALIRGASDYVGKPSNSMSTMNESFAVLEKELIPKIIGLALRQRNRVLTNTQTRSQVHKTGNGAIPSSRPTSSSAVRTPFISSAPQSRLKGAFKALCIGVSTGGPMALMDLFAQFQNPLKVPIFLVQHMPPTFTALLAARLTIVGCMTVKEPVHGEIAVPGVAYIAPGGFHMCLVKTLKGISIELNQGEPENSCRPAVDVLFRSAEAIYKDRLLAVMLTGMGYDGLKGCELISKSKGHIIAQDEETSVVWGMPGAVANAGLANTILPLGSIGKEITYLTTIG